MKKTLFNIHFREGKFHFCTHIHFSSKKVTSKSRKVEVFDLTIVKKLSTFRPKKAKVEKLKSRKVEKLKS